MSKLKDERETKGIEILKKLATEDPNSSVRAEAVKKLKKYMSDEELEAMYKERIANDQSYGVVTQALSSYGNLNEDAAMEAAKSLENENSSQMIAGIVTLYTASDDPEKFDFIYGALTSNTVQGFDKLGVLNSFTQYLVDQEPALIEKAYPAYEDQGNNGSFYMKLFIPQNIDYILNRLDSKVGSLNKDIEEHEANGDPALADQARAKIKKYEELIKKFSSLNEELKSKSEGSLIITSEEEEE